MIIRKTMEDFYTSVRAAAKQLEEGCRSIDDRQESIRSIIGGIKAAQCDDMQDNDISRLFHDRTLQFNKAIEQWKKAVNRYINSKEFVNKFEKSLLLIVFADVKAGKSSLGNFVSGYAFKDTPYGELYSKPDYFVYDHTDKSLGSCIEKPIPEGYFEEDVVQATASIQYFTLLDGLTWVDTPGIHSLTTEYEQLAKDYIKHADLILFLTPSNNPFKQDELDEINNLMSSGKPMLITITKSDSTMRRVQNGASVSVTMPKTQEDRTKQEKYGESKCFLKKDGIVSQNRYISISTKLAKQAMQQQDEEKFEQSNFPRFFEQIGQVISDKAVELKMQRPRDEVNFVINELIHGGSGDFIGAEELLSNLQYVIEQITAAENRLSLLKNSIIANAKGEIANEIYSMLCEQKDRNTITDKNAIAEKTGRIISDILSREISEAVGRELSDFREIQLAEAEVLIDADYKRKTKTIEYEYLDGRNRTREPRTLVEHVLHFFGKEYTEFTVKTKTLTKEIEVGDNFNEYADRIMENSQSSMEKMVCDEIARISKETYGRMKAAVEAMRSAVRQAADELEKLKY